jgi:molybdopterin/thiamine biosynthesis adenylyltransferase
MINRYSRQIALPEIGKEGQERLHTATAAIVGVGALGSVEAELLARAGIGHLVLIDFDLVEENNLPRQALYTEADIGKAKVEAATERISAINSSVEATAIMDHLEKKNISAHLDNVDIILDGTDNMETRFLINKHSYGKVPVIYTSAVKDKGSIFPVLGNGACYHCIYGSKQNAETCCEDGVLNGATHLAATIAATEAIKFLIGQPALEGIFSFSLFDSRFQTLKVKKNPDCKVCGKKE